MDSDREARPSDEWETPDLLFKKLHDEFDFAIDVCAAKDNWKVANYWTIEDNALLKSPEEWAARGPCWMNPPFSRALVPKFVKMARMVMDVGGVVLALLPAAIETRYFHAHVWDVADEVRMPDRRIQFVGAGAGAKSSNVFVVFRPHLGPTRVVRYPLTGREAGR